MFSCVGGGEGKASSNECKESLFIGINKDLLSGKLEISTIWNSDVGFWLDLILIWFDHKASKLLRNGEIFSHFWMRKLWNVLKIEWRKEGKKKGGDALSQGKEKRFYTKWIWVS